MSADDLWGCKADTKSDQAKVALATAIYAAYGAYQTCEVFHKDACGIPRVALRCPNQKLQEVIANYAAWAGKVMEAEADASKWHFTLAPGAASTPDAVADGLSASRIFASLEAETDTTGDETFFDFAISGLEVFEPHGEVMAYAVFGGHRDPKAPSCSAPESRLRFFGPE